MTQRLAVLLALAVMVGPVACSEDGPSASGKDKTSANKPTDYGKANAQPAQKIDHKKFEIDRVDDARFVIDDEALTQLLVDGIAGQIHVTRVNRGFRLDGYADDTLITKLGLKKGDVFVTVNDAILNNLHQVRVAFAKARKDGSVRIAIDRGGTSIQRRYYFRRTLNLGSDSYTSRYRRSKSLTGADYSKEKLLTAMKTGIKRVSDSHVKVDREVMVTVEANRDLLKDGLRWYRGLNKGYGVDDEFSFYKILGLTKYDTITKINGEDTGSRYTIERKLAAQGSAKELTINIDRLGEPLTIRYELVDGLVDKPTLAAAVDKWKDARSSSYGRYGRYGRKTSLGLGSSSSSAKTIAVRKINDTTFELSAADFKAMWSFMNIARGARIVPSIKNGKLNGVKVFAIRPSSSWSKLGFANGDTLQQIGSLKLDSATSFMDIAGKAVPAGTKRVVIRILRRGKPVDLVYKLK